MNRGLVAFISLTMSGCAAQVETFEILASDGCVVQVSGASAKAAESITESWEMKGCTVKRSESEGDE